MARSAVLLVIGAIAGSAGVWLVYEPQSGSGSDVVTAVESPPTQLIGVTEPVRLQELPPTSGAGFASERLAVFALAAETTSPSDLEEMIRRTAGDPESRSRNIRLTVLLSRLAELDPRRALAAARGQYLETRFMVPVFEIWAAANPDAAIAELAAIQPAIHQRQIALAILGVIGNDQKGFERVAAVLREADRTSLRIDALIERAKLDPAGSVAELMELPSAILQSTALTPVAEMVARVDPLAALALAETIDDASMRDTFMYRVLMAWGEVEPDALFAWFDSNDLTLLPDYSGVYRTLADSDPERLLAMIEQLPPGRRSYAQSAAMEVLAGRDPASAIALLDSMPSGQDRDRMLQAIAQGYGRKDPEQALEWARGLMPPSPNALSAVLQGIAATDPERAIDLVVADLESAGTGNINAASSYMSLILNVTTSNNIDVARVIDRLIEVENPLLQSMLSSAIGNWARRDSAAALNWAIENADRVDASMFRNIAQTMAETDLSLAISTLDRLPPAQQAGWLEGLAGRLAQTDMNQAKGLLNRFRGQPGYGRAYGSVARQLARSDPGAAAEMLSRATGLTGSDLSSATLNVAREFAARDPANAARWAAELEDAQARSQAVSSVVQVWAQTDSTRARQWLLGMNRGSDRDQALTAFLSVAAQAGRFESDLMGAFSNEQQAQQGASRAIVQIGRADLEAARRLLETHITDPVVRRQTEENLSRTGGSGGSSGFLISNGIIFR